MSSSSPTKSFCPVCQGTYQDSPTGFCTIDGARLRPWAELGARWVGETVADKYRVLRFLGSGASAEVYEAEHVELGRHVALKLLQPWLVCEPTVVERFRQEARLVSLIAHPNVVGIEDVGALPDGTLFMVMELLRGRSLEQALADGALDPGFALDVAVQVCDGLQAAHDKSIVHRDVKPGNIYLCTRDGQGEAQGVEVKILDLGLAKLHGQDAVSNLTVTGTIFGTPEYMSPQQAVGEEVDHRSDLYSLGVVLYEMLLGQVPFTAGSFLGVLTKHLTETPRWPAQLAAERGLPPGAEALVLRALAKSPELRFRTAGELRSALRELRAALGPVTGAAARRSPGSAPTVHAARSAPRATPVRRVSLLEAGGTDHEVVELAPDVFWVGRRQGGLLECNSYLRVFRGAGRQVTMLIDPGPPRDLDVVAAKVGAVVGSLDKVDLIFLNHQDPDVAASAPLVQQLNPRAHLLCSEDTWRLVRFYGLRAQGYSATEQFADSRMRLATGHVLSFVPTPYCHFRGAVMLYDHATRVLFSGDLFGGLSRQAVLVGGDAHWPDVEIFHQLYMPSRKALRLAMDRIRQLEPAPQLIAPQHGAILEGPRVDAAVKRLGELEVGVDLASRRGDKPRVLGALGQLIAELETKLGGEELARRLRHFSSDGSFPNLFTFSGELGIVDIKIEPRAAARALVRDLVAATEPLAQAELAALATRIFALRGVSLKLAPEDESPPESAALRGS